MLQGKQLRDPFVSWPDIEMMEVEVTDEEFAENSDQDPDPVDEDA